MSRGDIGFYTDTLIVETILGDSFPMKTAQEGGMLSGVASSIKDYVAEHIDQNDKAGSIINILAPAAISTLFKFFGFGKLGLLFGVVASAMHIDVARMVEPIWNEVKNTLSNGQKVNPSQIDNAVSQSIQQFTPSDQAPTDDQLENNLAQDLRVARMLRLSLEQYEHQMMRLTKEENPKAIFSFAAGRTARTTSLIGRIIGWIFKIVLMAGGFMVAGDVANKLLGRPNAIDKTYQSGQQPFGGPSAVPGPVTTQTKFKSTQSGTSPSPQPWGESITNDPGSIENMLIEFAKQVYSGLDGHEEVIRSSPIFQAVKNQITWYNHTAAGAPIVYIPRMYPDKKAIVDHFIDEVAKNSV